MTSLSDVTSRQIWHDSTGIVKSLALVLWREDVRYYLTTNPPLFRRPPSLYEYYANMPLTPRFQLISFLLVFSPLVDQHLWDRPRLRKIAYTFFGILATQEFLPYLFWPSLHTCVLSLLRLARDPTDEGRRVRRQVLVASLTCSATVLWINKGRIPRNLGELQNNWEDWKRNLTGLLRSIVQRVSSSFRPSPPDGTGQSLHSQADRGSGRGGVEGVRTLQRERVGEQQRQTQTAHVWGPGYRLGSDNP